MNRGAPRRPAATYLPSGVTGRRAAVLAATTGAELREGLTTVTRGTLLVMVTTLSLVAFNFLSRWILVRTDLSAWNSFSYCLAVAGILSSVGTLGLPSAVARGLPYASTDAERRTIVRTSIAVSAAGAAAIGLTLWIVAPRLATSLGNPALRIGLEYFSIVVVASIGSGLVASIFQGYSDVLPNALFVQLLNPALFFGILLVFVVVPPSHLTYTEALASFAAANVITLAACVTYSVRRLPRHLPPGPPAPEARGRLLRFAAPLFAAAAMLSLAGSGDTLVLGIFRPPSDVGIYTASLTLARLLSIGISAASFIFLPVATGFLRRENHRAIQLTYTAVTKWMLLFSLPLFLVFIVLPSSSLAFVYGTRLATIVVPLELAVGGAFVATILGPAATIQIAYGRVRLLAINSAVAGVTDVTIALLLVPGYGYVGAAFAWGFSTSLYAALCVIELAVLDRIHPFGRSFIVPLLGTSIPFALALLPLRLLGIAVPLWSLPPVAFAVAGAFVLVVLVTRSLDEGDRLLLGAVEHLIGRPVPFVRRLARWIGSR